MSHRNDSTFASRISRNSNHQVGRPTALTKTEEKNLVDLIITLQDYGEISTCDDVLKNATEFVDIMNLKSRLKNDAPTRDWYYSFLRRWKDKLKIMNSTKLEKVRANVTLSTVDGWFAKLHSVLLKLDLFNKPQQLFNCDENGFRDDPGKKVVQKDATKKLVKPNFIRLHAQLYQYALIRAHCSSALGKAGIFPYDPRAIKRDKLIKASSCSTTSNVLPRSKSVEFNYLDNEVITTTSPSPSRLDSNRNHQLVKYPPDPALFSEKNRSLDAIEAMVKKYFSQSSTICTKGKKRVVSGAKGRIVTDFDKFALTTIKEKKTIEAKLTNT
ncbi:unnamed protein product [Rotaria socialis]|uniref:HTH CENPB-type domain-containing protein n=1 Tax=Rotaria socialis TaxID=392032 RepID=A0A819BGG2_9BILA|nr:unnamed protein product [Rotaria socialis]